MRLQPFGEIENEPTHVTVFIGLKDQEQQAPFRLWILDIALPRSEAKYVRDELEKVVYRKGVTYQITVKEGRVGWGAGGGLTQEVVLFLAGSTTNGIIAAATMKFFERLISRQRQHGTQFDGEGSGRLNRESALSYAKWLVLSRYPSIANAIENLPSIDDPLEVLSETQDIEADSWKFSFRDTEGAVYRITIVMMDSVPTTKIIERDAPSE